MSARKVAENAAQDLMRPPAEAVENHFGARGLRVALGKEPMPPMPEWCRNKPPETPA